VVIVMAMERASRPECQWQVSAAIGLRERDTLYKRTVEQRASMEFGRGHERG